MAASLEWFNDRSPHFLYFTIKLWPECNCTYWPVIKFNFLVFIKGRIPGCQTKIAAFMTFNRISIGKIRLVFSFYLNFNISVLANI